MDCSSTKSTFLPNKSCNEYLKSPVYLVSLAQGNYVLDMIVYQFHLSQI